tara:strand:- start:4151 stop:5617 length:1467 start_codon:yes stop_codon:yes gene_type:complete
MIASQKQEAIYHVWRNESSNILINAVAGSGKTTTLLQLVEYCRHRTLFVAFNKSVQEEIQTRLTDRGLKQGKAMTIHSLGLKAIKSKYGSVKINNGKNFDIIKSVQKNNRAIFKTMSWEQILKISYTLMDMNDASRLFLSDDLEEIKGYLLSIGKSFYASIHIEKLWSEFLVFRKASYEQRTVEVDFTDMIYLPVYKELHIPINPYYLMIDEAQDLNLCQHKLIDNLINQGTIIKWIAVGDRNQAIYGFSGASSSSFDMFVQKGNVKELTLDICYRCSTTIIDAANEVYNVMQYSKASPGKVEIVTSPVKIEPDAMVICRNTEPLVKLFFQLLSLEKSAYIRGDDILNSIIRFLKPYNSYTADGAKMEMLIEMEKLSYDKTEKGRITAFIFKENFSNFKLLYENLANGYEKVEDLIIKVKNLFKSKKDSIMLCTIHKSKGLEADTVYILNEKLIPSKFAKSEEQLKQEMNLKYVARTRAKEQLYYLNL